MKLKLLFTILICMVVIKVYAYDISVENADGITIYYNYINGGQELEVTYKSKYDYLATTHFSGYNNITTIVIPEKVTYLGETKNVIRIGESAFAKCSELVSVTIPNSIVSIGQGAFNLCALVSLNIPNSVKSIEESAFLACNALSSISFGNSVTSIGFKAFAMCSSLTSLIIPNSVTTIDNCAFEECKKLSSLIIGKNVKIIGSGAFRNCSKLNEIESLIEAPEDISSGAFTTEVYNNVKLCVPIGTKYKYKACKGWQEFITIEEKADDSPKYKLTYIVDGEVYKTYEIEFGSTITPETEPTKEGYTFSGWSEIPETMPDHDVTVTGTFTSTLPKCATPTIQIENGQLKLSCETKGVSFCTSYTAEGTFNTKNGNEVVTSGPVVCHISVYATKKDYQNSDVATIDVELCVGQKGDVNQDGAVSITDAVTVVNIILNNGEATAPAMESPALEAPEVGEPE